MGIQVNGVLVETDAEGFLVDIDAWDDTICSALAQESGIELTDCHQEIIRVMRNFYQEYQISPSMHRLKKELQPHPELECDTRYLKSLFKSSDVCASVCRLAGLPKPFCDRC